MPSTDRSRPSTPAHTAETPGRLAGAPHRPEPSSRPGLSRRALLTLLAVAAFTAAGLLRFTYLYLDDLTRDHPGTFLRRLIEELTGGYASLALFAGIVWLFRRFPLDRPGWPRRVPVHLLGALAYSAAHTSILWATRAAIFPLAGLGAYDYGRMPMRYAMELGNDILSYAVFVSVIVAFRYYDALQERELRASELERGLAQAELRSLRLQLQPHFLFNALNTISATMYDDPAAADVMIGQLSDLLRLSLRTAHTHEVPLSAELETLELYAAIMRARFGDRLAIEVDAEPEARDAMVPSLLLQPLVENAVRHGNATRLGFGRVSVRARRVRDGKGGRRPQLLLEVADDGPGVEPARDVVGAGLGLSTTASRLRLLYGDEHRFAAGNAPGGGFVVTIVVPFAAAPRRGVEHAGVGGGEEAHARPHR
jgi:signal transduction histidine kinase